MRTGTTRTGFAFDYDEGRLDDMRIVDALAEATDEEAQEFERLRGMTRVVELLLGRETKRALYDHIGKSHEGRVPAAALQAELEDIMLPAGKDAAKN